MRSSCCMSHESRLLHCLFWLNRQRQSPRRYENHVRKETYYNTIDCALKGTIRAYKVSTGLINHTRDIYRWLRSRLWITVNLLDLQTALNTASINAFHYVWTVIPPNARFYVDMPLWLRYTLHGVGCQVSDHTRTHLAATTIVWLYSPIAKL